MANPSVAIATCKDFPDLLEDDLLLVRALEQANFSVTPAVWDNKSINWSAFDIVLVRSPWDYYLKPVEYANWVNQFLNSKTTLLNPPQAILNNIDKSYLMDFEKSGIPIIPTELVKRDAEVSLNSIIHERNWDNVVIKPVVSAGAYGTWRSSLRASKHDQIKFTEQNSRETLLIQPFMPEIQNQGEWSIIYIDGKYSHAVLKSVKGNDFRIQEEHGGTTKAIEPSEDILNQTQRIMDLQQDHLLYARVDGVICDGEFLLMELEINEPSLFFVYSEDAPRKLAESMINYI